MAVMLSSLVTLVIMLLGKLCVTVSQTGNGQQENSLAMVRIVVLNIGVILGFNCVVYVCV